MPSKSQAQHRLMEAAAHTRGGYDGVPQSVGRDFAAADKGSPKSRDEHMRRRAKAVGQKAAGADFARSQSTVSRAAMRAGFTQGGKA